MALCLGYENVSFFVAAYQILTENEDAEQGVPSRITNMIYSEMGRPRYDIRKEDIQFLLEQCFTVQDIADIFGVSKSTMHSRMQGFALSVTNTYSDMTEQELDHLIGQKISESPYSGIQSMIGILRSSGYRVQRHKVISSMRRVDPVGVLMRKTMRNYQIRRRRYNVRAPKALWHVDSNHKLIRY